LHRRFDEPLVLTELVGSWDGVAHLEELDRARHGRDDLPLERDAEKLAEDREHVVHGLAALRREVRLEMLDVLVGDRIELLVAEYRNEMVPRDRLLRLDAARLLAVGRRVAFDESRVKLFEGRDLLLGFRVGTLGG